MWFWLCPFSDSASSIPAPRVNRREVALRSGPTARSETGGLSSNLLKLTLIADADEPGIGRTALSIHVAQGRVVQTVLLLDAHVSISLETSDALALVIGRIPINISAEMY